MAGLDKSLVDFDFTQLTATDFGKDKLVKLIIKIGDGIKKSELTTRDVCIEYLNRLRESLTVKDLAGVVNSSVSNSMIALMQYQFAAPPPAPESPVEETELEAPTLEPEMPVEPTKKERKASSSSSTSMETWKCMENLLEKLAKVAINNDKENQPASMPPVYQLEDNNVSFKKFCHTELARWFRFEKISDASRAEYFPYVFDDTAFAEKVENFCLGEDKATSYDFLIDAISELVESRIGEIQDRREDKDRVEEFNELNNTAWEICDSPNATPRQSLSEAPAVADAEMAAIQQRVADMNLEQERLTAMQSEIENVVPSAPSKAGYPSIEDKIEADIRSVFVGQVDYACSAAEVEAHFRPCGDLNRVTILCDKYTYHPKGFAYVEFSSAKSVPNALAMDGTYLKGRALRVLPKRTNNPSFTAKKAHGFKPRHSHAGVFKPVNNFY